MPCRKATINCGFYLHSPPANLYTNTGRSRPCSVSDCASQNGNRKSRFQSPDGQSIHKRAITVSLAVWDSLGTVNMRCFWVKISQLGEYRVTKLLSILLQSEYCLLQRKSWTSFKVLVGACQSVCGVGWGGVGWGGGCRSLASKGFH